ncbi:pseudouridine synthase [Bacillus sp. FJAT-42376]|uniref:pseudouridine synthase n=1 Tax=Bacillus sp. FJAT-42376 TaxID=2014076 RepID=UPI000F50F832|nr:pseudouridine synthase [Bacillus sp. FJAT-42376]AZB44690.1 pseudouridine synthase [Bacillus sp. FJAT-42376]
MRINKFMSLSGYWSRREIDRFIEAGLITVNGQVCLSGQEVSLEDTVLVKGQPIPEKEQSVYIVLNKPPGIVCTAVRSVKNNLVDYMNYPVRIFPVGRLDKDSQGLLIMTNDGDISNRILRSEHNHEKEYIVTVSEPFGDDFLEKMGRGVEILGTVTKRCAVTRISSDTFRIILTQGLNRQIRRMCKELGFYVTRLERVRLMNIMLEGIELGAWRHLSDDERQTLFTALYGGTKTASPV